VLPSGSWGTSSRCPPVTPQFLKDFSDSNLLEGHKELQFGDTDLRARMQFFGSALYRDYVHLRCDALLDAAREATAAEKRQGFLRTLEAVAGGLEAGEGEGERQKHASWALSLAPPDVPPETRLRFALAAYAPERMAFAATFARVGNDPLDWDALGVFASVTDMPASVGHDAFFKMLEFVAQHGLRKNVPNPIAQQFLEARSDVVAAVGDDPPTGWAAGFLSASAKARFSANHWRPDPAFHQASVPPEHIALTAKAVGKLWGLRSPPQWAVALRERAVAERAVAAKALAKDGPPSASKVTEEPALAPDAESTGAAEAAPVAPGAAASAPGAAASAPGTNLSGGDIVLLLPAAGAKLDGKQGEVTKCSAKSRTIEVTLVGGKKPVTKKVKRSAVELLVSAQAAGHGDGAADDAENVGAGAGGASPMREEDTEELADMLMGDE